MSQWTEINILPSHASERQISLSLFDQDMSWLICNGMASSDACKNKPKWLCQSNELMAGECELKFHWSIEFVSFMHSTTALSQYSSKGNVRSIRWLSIGEQRDYLLNSDGWLLKRNKIYACRCPWKVSFHFRKLPIVDQRNDIHSLTVGDNLSGKYWNFIHRFTFSSIGRSIALPSQTVGWNHLFDMETTSSLMIIERRQGRRDRSSLLSAEKNSARALIGTNERERKRAQEMRSFFLFSFTSDTRPTIHVPVTATLSSNLWITNIIEGREREKEEKRPERRKAPST